jgi:hypothetical protein
LEVSGQLHAPSALPTRKVPAVFFEEEVGWAPEPVWKTSRGEKSCHYRNSNFDPSALQSVDSLYCDCGILSHQVYLFIINNYPDLNALRLTALNKRPGFQIP